MPRHEHAIFGARIVRRGLLFQRVLPYYLIQSCMGECGPLLCLFVHPPTRNWAPKLPYGFDPCSSGSSLQRARYGSWTDPSYLFDHSSLKGLRGQHYWRNDLRPMIFLKPVLILAFLCVLPVFRIRDAKVLRTFSDSSFASSVCSNCSIGFLWLSPFVIANLCDACSARQCCGSAVLRCKLRTPRSASTRLGADCRMPTCTSQMSV